MDLTLGNTQPNYCSADLFIGHDKIHFRKFCLILQAVIFNVAISTLTTLGKPATGKVSAIGQFRLLNPAR